MSEQTWIDPRVDRALWPAGDWDGEPDKVQWTDKRTGLVCLAKRQSRSGHWCGYVGVGKAHPWHEKGYSELPDYGPSCHFGLTFAGACQEGPPAETVCHVPEAGAEDHLWWFGFDCSHCDDYSPQDAVYARDRGYPFTLDRDATYKDLHYVRSECANLAAQIHAVRA